MPEDDSFLEIMALLHRRNQICSEWMERIGREFEDNDITYGEYMHRAQMIREDMARAHESFRH